MNRPTEQSADTRVMIVEDEPRLRDLLARSMPDMGFVPLTAGSAEEALRILDKQPIDIAMVDLNLPGMDGMTLFETLRQTCPTLPVIVLTGYGDLAAAQQAIHLDVVEFLTKPCPLGEIEAALDRALRRLHDPDTPAPETVRTSPGLLHEPPAPTDMPSPPTLADMERRAILDALRRHNNNRAAAARELGISVRTLYYRLQQYDRDNTER